MTPVTTEAGSTLALAGTLEAGSIDAQGLVTFSNGVLNLGGSGGTIARAETSSDATIATTGELSIGQMTVGNGDSLIKQGFGTLILDQSGGANSFDRQFVDRRRGGRRGGRQRRRPTIRWDRPT